MKTRQYLLPLVLGLVLAITPLVTSRVLADGEITTGKSIVEQIGCDQTVEVNGVIGVNHACQVNDFINLFIYLSKWGMSILAVLATLMFIYGGFQFVTAGGRPSKVDEGKRVLTGTIIGVIISLTAYVIINTTVTAVSGFTLTSTNFIGVVFDPSNPNNKINGQTISKAFSGSNPTSPGSSTTTVEACRLESSSWVRDCSDTNLQAYCADAGPHDGVITTLQKQLSGSGTDGHGCDCGGPADGCYGKGTVSCVRRFQIANNLPPTGVIDTTTKSYIEDPSKADCGSTEEAAVSANLPATVLDKSDGGDSKCCVVNNGTNDLYCVGGISTRACKSLGGGSTAYEGACGSGATTGKCGFCSNTPSPTQSNGSQCFMSASPYWCTTTSTSGTYFNNDCRANCFKCTTSIHNSFSSF